MFETISDLSLFFRFLDKTIISLIENYVAENLNAGNNVFQNKSELTSNAFESKATDPQQLFVL